MLLLKSDVEGKEEGGVHCTSLAELRQLDYVESAGIVKKHDPHSAPTFLQMGK